MPAKSAARRRKQAHKGKPAARYGAATQAAAAPQAVRPKHGGWLTAMIVIMAVHGVFNTVALLALRNQLAYRSVPSWLYAGAFFVGLATIASAVALWYWKRWGLYLYVVATFVSLALGLVVYPTQLAAFYNLIPLGILGWILTSQRKMQLLT
jgi:hypothetical protein